MGEPIDQIVRTIERRRKIADWSVQRVELRSTQHYLVGRSPESRRTVHSVTYPVMIYHDHNDQRGAPVRGSASVTLLPDLSNMAVALDDAAMMAASVHNRPYGIPVPASYPAVETVDTRIIEEPEQLARELLESLVKALDGERDIE